MKRQSVRSRLRGGFTAKELLVVIPGNSASGGQTQAQASAYLAQNYAQYAKTPTVVRNAIKTSKMDLQLPEATARISASQVGDLGFGQIKATGPNKQDAERLTRFASSSLINTIQAQQTNAKFADLGEDAIGSTPAELAAFMEDERKKWAEVVKAADIKIE